MAREEKVERKESVAGPRGGLSKRLIFFGRGSALPSPEEGKEC